MNSEERYNAWLKDALAYGYCMSDIQDLFGSDTSKSLGDIIIEGFISEKIVSGDKDGTVYFMISENAKDEGIGNTIMAHASGDCHTMFSNINDFACVAGRYDANKMQIGINRFFNKSLAKRLLNEKEYDVNEIKLKRDNDGR